MPSSFTLGTHFEGFIKSQIESGRYASASEVVRDSLRLLEEQEAMRVARLEALRVEIDLARQGGPAIPAAEAFAHARARIGDIASTRTDD